MEPPGRGNRLNLRPKVRPEVLAGVPSLARVPIRKRAEVDV